MRQGEREENTAAFPEGVRSLQLDSRDALAVQMYLSLGSLKAVSHLSLYISRGIPNRVWNTLVASNWYRTIEGQGNDRSEVCM